ncbi:hypothetical protein P3H80_01240 [Mycolicibacterium septicum]|nr:hypothetical protein [Mycolicibacterium septicum]MDF3336022.1 hypothetical protein [Mycolicibacterium septicum]
MSQSRCGAAKRTAGSFRNGSLSNIAAVHRAPELSSAPVAEVFS